MKGKFISFEGGDGTGKSTQSDIVCDMFSSQNIDYVKTREPGGTKISERIREFVLDAKVNGLNVDTEILLFAASRAQLVNDVILPALNSGKMVICDRFVDSSFVYQGLANGDNLEKVKWANKFVLDNCMPDCTLYLDLDPVEAFRRKNGADENDRIEMKGLDYQYRIREGFLTLAKMYPDRIKVIDASRTKEEVTAQIFEALKETGI